MSTEMAEMNTENATMITKVAENIPEVAETDEQKLARLATEINTIKVQTQAVIQNATLEIGKRLTQAKAAVPHGMWGQWLKTAVDYSERTAQMLMTTYERFGGTEQKLFGPQVDTELVAQLSRSQMFALMSIKDEDACIEFMNEHKEELPNMTKRELEQAIKERDQAKADLEAWRTQCDSLTDTANKATQRAEKLRAELAQLKADTAAGNDELEKLKHENETLQTSLEMEKRNSKDSYDDAVEAQRKLCEERDKYEEQIKALKEAQEGTENEELKRLQVETAARAGRIKALEKELEDLKNAQQAPPPAPPEKTREEKAFARHFENAKGEFNAMIDTVDEMPEDLRAKYKAAMKQLMEVMTALVIEA